VGQPVSGLSEKAKSLGLFVFVGEDPRHSSPEEKVIIAGGGFGFARHFCRISYNGQTVTEKKLSFMD
jgi:hypothetical protein